MSIEQCLRLLAGFFVLASLALGWWVSPYFFLFTAFVGLNLLQSSFTRWCPAMAVLRKLGVKSEGEIYLARRERGSRGPAVLGPEAAKSHDVIEALKDEN